MVVRHRALFRVLHNSARKNAIRHFVYRFLRVGWNAGVLTVGAFTALGMTSAIVGGTVFDGVSRDAYRLGAFIGLQAGGPGAVYLGQGWGAADDVGRWIGESAALIEVPMKAFPPRDVILTMEVRGDALPNAKEVVLDVLVNGEMVEHARLAPPGNAKAGFNVTVPASVLARHGKTAIICLFASSDARADSDDPQLPLLRVERLRLSDAS